MIKKLKAIRGAVCCENNADSISNSVISLYSEILKENKIEEKDIVSIQFTVTDDINAKNPASALRANGFAQRIPLFCSAEANFLDSMPKCIRILIHCYSRKKTKHIYLGDAKKLRPDLAQ